MKKNLWITLAAVLCAIAVIGAGNYLWKLKKEDVLKKMNTVKDFSLLDAEGKFFQFSKTPADQKILFIFTADHPTQEDVNSLFTLSKKEESFAKKKIQLILISRGHVDTIKNFRKASRFHGPLLLDASGSVGRIFGAWPTIAESPMWLSVLTDNGMHVYWRKIGKTAPDFSALSEILN